MDISTSCSSCSSRVPTMWPPTCSILVHLKNVLNLPSMVNSLWISSADLLLLEWTMISMTRCFVAVGMIFFYMLLTWMILLNFLQCCPWFQRFVLLKIYLDVSLLASLGPSAMNKFAFCKSRTVLKKLLILYLWFISTEDFC